MTVPVTSGSLATPYSVLLDSRSVIHSPAVDCKTTLFRCLVTIPDHIDTRARLFPFVAGRSGRPLMPQIDAAEWHRIIRVSVLECRET
jgi:hypothetical protein